MVLLIYGLMSDPTPIVHLVCQHWIDDGRKSIGKTLIESMFYEAGLPVPKDLLHNQLINFHRNKDTTPVHVPSRLYVFDDMKAKVSCNIHHGIKEIPECVIRITFPAKTVGKTLISVCKTICEHQAIRELYLRQVDWYFVPDTDVFNLSKTAQSVTLVHCELPSQTLNHLIQQINESKTLRKINLRGTRLVGFSLLRLSNKKNLTHLDLYDPSMSAQLAAAVCYELSELVHLEHLNLSRNDLREVSSLTLSNKRNLTHLDLSGEPLIERTHMSAQLAAAVCYELSELVHLEHLNLSENDLSEVSSLTLSNKKSLRYLNLSNTLMSADLCRSVCYQLNKLLNLEYIDLSQNTLTGCLSSFVPNTHPGLPKLKELDLDRTALNKHDLKHLLSVAHKLPKLRKLDLSENTLTGCLSSFLPDPHPGLPQLKQLRLGHTALNKHDLKHLLSVAQKLPKLWLLDLAGNNLTGYLSSFVPDPHPGLIQLQHLKLNHTALNKDDLNHITHLIQTQKLPGLEELDLDGNSLSEIEVGPLIEACVTHHQRRLGLWLVGNDLSEEFKNKWKQWCEGTDIVPDFEFQ